MLSRLPFCVSLVSPSICRRISRISPVLIDSITGSAKTIQQTGDYYSWYSCGPTVYDLSHVGHARNYVTIDLLQRILESQFGINISSAMGITNIDDKIINRSKDTNTSWKDITSKYEDEFFHDLGRLNVKRALSVVRVSDMIPEIIDCIKVLLEKEIAYVTSSGVYFDTQSSHYAYSKLVPSVIDEDTKSRLNCDVEKRHSRDFALWKNYSPVVIGNSETTWASPWGAGRPGWHIECSTNCIKLFGNHLDMHAGGIDLRFPHHCNEIAQCEAFSGHPSWCDHMVHIGHIFIEGRKMSKSLKNFISITDMLSDYTSDEFRFFCLINRYSARVQLDKHTLENAKSLWTVMKESLFLLATEVSKTDTFNDKCPIQQVLLWIEQLSALKRDIAMCFADDMNTNQVVTILTNCLHFASRQMLQSRRTVPLEVSKRMVEYIRNLLVDLGFEEVCERKGKIQGDIKPVIDELCQFRHSIRISCLQSEKSELRNLILQQCDTVRNKMSDHHSISIIDGNSDVLWVTGQQQTKVVETQLKPSLTPQIPPSEMFALSKEYSAFDEEGFPTHDRLNKPLSESKVKKLRKKYTIHKAIHEKWKSQQK